MEKTYNAACMALPEKDEDLFARINERTARRRKEAEQALYFDNVYADAVEVEEEPATREPEIRKALPWVAAVAMSVLALLLGRMM